MPMIFHDSQVEGLDLTSPSDVQELVEVHLCGHAMPSQLSDTDQQLLKEFVEKAFPAGVTFKQFNELLLVLNQDRASRTFLDFFFSSEQAGDDQLTLGMLKQGVKRFKGFAMICFGNFRFAFSRLSTITSVDWLHEELGDCCRRSGEVRRTDPRDHTDMARSLRG